MKKIIAGFAIMMAMTIGAQAQDSLKTKEHHGGGGGHHKEMYKDLDLTAEQKQDAKKLNADFKVKMDAVKNDASLSEDARKDKKKAVFQERQEAFKNLLTADQKVKFDEQQKQMKEKRMKHAGKDV
ncbi:MAG: hypothetical protein ABI687_09630 [Flavitalea sp.]